MQTSLLDGARNDTPTLPPAHVSASDLRSVVSGFRGFSILASDLGVRGGLPLVAVHTHPSHSGASPCRRAIKSSQIKALQEDTQGEQEARVLAPEKDIAGLLVPPQQLEINRQ